VLWIHQFPDELLILSDTSVDTTRFRGDSQKVYDILAAFVNQSRVPV